MSSFREEFLLFAHQQQALKFGEFVTKAGRLSPYFFNAGLFSDGQSLFTLARFYAQAILASNLHFDMLFGPAYKGITLAAATTMALTEHNKNIPFAFNRKEAKDHGEGGTLVGAPLKGDILIIDDVITAGTSVRESVEIILQNNARPAGVVVALDRMEKGQHDLSAIAQVERDFGIPVISIATLEHLIGLAQDNPAFQEYLPQMLAYRNQYGA